MKTIIHRKIYTLVLKSYMCSAAIFGGKCHPFCRALSSVVSLYSATGIDPKVLQVIYSCLFSTKSDLLIARLVLSSTILQVFKGDLLSARSPCVGKYRIGRNVLVTKLSKTEIISVVANL